MNPNPRDRGDIEVAGLRARVATLEQLLEVYERSVIEQSDRLYAEQERIRIQKTLLESQGEASLDGILSVGRDGTILFANRRLSEMWGVAPPAVGASDCDRVLASLAEHTVDAAEFLECCAALTAAGEGRAEVRLRDGRVFDQYTAPIPGAGGEPLGRVWYFRDISAFREMDRIKDEFISAVSHELRTPLTSIRGSLGLMASGSMGALPPEAKASVELALRSCERLTRLLDDVLDIEKMGAGRVAFRLEVLELEPIVLQSIESMRPYGDQLGVSIRLEGFAPTLRVRADPDRLIQVMQNLLSNAAKFSPRGERVQVTIARRGAAVRVSVTDRGPGIAMGFQPRVFEKFAQGGTPGVRDRAGTGLGLAISRAIVERLGGSIDFVSRPGVGTTFYFELPRWHEEATEATP